MSSFKKKKTGPQPHSSSSKNSNGNTTDNKEKIRYPVDIGVAQYFEHLFPGSTIPGGLDIMWREIPNSVRFLLHVNDVPSTAKTRGYCTVGELLHLKRLLLQRAANYEAAPAAGSGHVHQDQGHYLRSVQMTQFLAQQQQQQQQPPPPPQHGLQAQGSSETGAPTGQGMMMEVGPSAPPPPPPPHSSQQHMTEQTAGCSTSAYCGAANSGQVSHSANIAAALAQGEPTAQRHHHHLQAVAEEGSGGGANRSARRESGEQVLGIPSSSYMEGFAQPIGMDSPVVPVYRSITLVLKHLQIGNFAFRSFSEVNPNRCKVSYKSRKISYECFLPFVLPIQGSTQQFLRKLLRMDISFDQLSMLRFEGDKLFLRVEGGPYLSITYSEVSEDDKAITVIGAEDQYLLDQIESGRLDLTPNHELYFLNERLVHNLKTHFSQLPQFQNLFMRHGGSGEVGGQDQLEPKLQQPQQQKLEKEEPK